MKYNLQKTYKIREKIFAFYLDGCIAKEKKKSCFLWDYFLFHKIFLFFVIFITGSIISISWVLLYMKRRKAIDYQRFQVQQQNQDSIFEIISGMSEIKLNNAEQSKIKQWKAVQSKLFDINFKEAMENLVRQPQNPKTPVI